MPRNRIFNFGIITLFHTLTLCVTANAVPQIPGNFSQIDMEDGGYLVGLIQHCSGQLVCRADGGAAANAAGTTGIGAFTDTNTLSSRARFYRLGLP
jgi:hypothetical protein